MFYSDILTTLIFGKVGVGSGPIAKLYISHVLHLYKQFGKPDKTYFAPDCFHFGIKAHAVAAKELWNNMVISILNMLTIRE